MKVLTPGRFASAGFFDSLERQALKLTNMKIIKLTRGLEAIVDDGVFEEIGHLKWHADPRGYALRKVTSQCGKYVASYMHREILGLKYGDIDLVDHVNRNKLDNRLENLRICNRSENAINANKPKTNTSGFKGVMFDNKSKKWRAKITKNKNTISLGSFDSPELAAEAYRVESIKLHGKYSIFGG